MNRTKKRARLRRIVGAIALCLSVLGAVVVLRTLRFESRQNRWEKIAVTGALPALPSAAEAAARLGEAVRIRTIIQDPPAPPPAAEFRRLFRLLQRSFPRVHRTLELEKVSDFSLLYRWPGKKPGKAILFSAHFDVVPVDPATESAWEAPPFSGAVQGGFIHGRGTIDDKAAAMGLLEAAEALLGTGFTPERDIYFAFGHDEEVGGRKGAMEMAALLAQRGVRLEFVLDEGSVITDASNVGIARPLALIGITEKGAIDLELKVKAEGGHSSMPPEQTAIGVLAAGIARLEANPFPKTISPPFASLLNYIGPEMGFVSRMAIANQWLFAPLLKRRFSARSSTRALLQTTQAVTIVYGGLKSNILPPEATALVNFRILPGETIKSVEARVKRVLADGRISVRVNPETFAGDPPPVSDPETEAFARIARTVSEIVPNAVVAPYLVVGATDSRHYVGITDNIYRFSPLTLLPADYARVHGVGERIGIGDYHKMIRFYARFLMLH